MLNREVDATLKRGGYSSTTTIAEYLVNKGKEEGKLEGIRKGIKTTREIRFGFIPEQVNQV